MHLNSQIWVLRHRRWGILMGPAAEQDTLGDPFLAFPSREAAIHLLLKNKRPQDWNAEQIVGMQRPANELPLKHLASV